MAKETLEYKQLFAGEVHGMTRVAVGAGTYYRGQVLELKVTEAVASTDVTTTPATQYAAPTSEDLAIKNEYVICDEDVTLSGAGTVPSFRFGYFNKDLVTYNGTAQVSDKGIQVLQTKGIFLEDVVKA